jgi:uncharacterized membrane protein YoaK (UPF0700 family)
MNKKRINLINFFPKMSETLLFTGVSTLLMATAGLVNSIAILGIHGSSVAHVTGNASSFAIELSNGLFSLHLFLLVFVFFLGAFFTGSFLGSRVYKKENRYGSLLIFQSLLLIGGSILYLNKIEFSSYTFSFCCGIQNAIVMTYRGSIIRTTHLTGIVTDLGSYLGNKLRGVPVESWRIYMNSSQIFGFLAGSYLGAYFFRSYGLVIVWIPALVSFVIGVSFRIYKRNESSEPESPNLNYLNKS